MRTIVATVAVAVSIFFLWTGTDNLELSIGHREILGAFWILLAGTLLLVAENGDRR